MLVYNNEPALVDIILTKGDTFAMTFSVALNGAAYDLTGMQLDIKLRRSNGTLYRELSSAGSPAEISIAAASYTITTSAIPETGRFKYDVQLTDGARVSTIQKGIITVQEEQT
jgi:hypothetical protein